ncbi:MAG: hypothetical protein VXZ73_00510 [Pseudomonadota bacterium]|nr:hypothetical protein [Pseudomonadota bacterium]
MKNQHALEPTVSDYVIRVLNKIARKKPITIVYLVGNIDDPDFQKKIAKLDKTIEKRHIVTVNPSHIEKINRLQKKYESTIHIHGQISPQTTAECLAKIDHNIVLCIDENSPAKIIARIKRMSIVQLKVSFQKNIYKQSLFTTAYNLLKRNKAYHQIAALNQTHVILQLLPTTTPELLRDLDAKHPVIIDFQTTSTQVRSLSNPKKDQARRFFILPNANSLACSHISNFSNIHLHPNCTPEIINYLPKKWTCIGTKSTPKKCLKKLPINVQIVAEKSFRTTQANCVPVDCEILCDDPAIFDTDIFSIKKSP